MIDTATLTPGQFSGDPLIRKINNRQAWQLAEALAYRSRDGRLFIVPAGFETDGASVPRPLWWLYPPFGGEYDRAAIIHDYLYTHAEHVVGDDDGHISRGAVDGLMLEMMEVDEFRRTGRRTVHAGVRLGGWRPWRRYRAEAGKA
jgi:hypothetical protein